MQKAWTVKKHDHAAIVELSKTMDVSPLVAALLINRGHDTPEKAERFLRPSISHLHDPGLLLNMDKAVRRIMKAIANREKILIWGDYDVDGTTGTVLLRKVLNDLGAETSFHIPDRFIEGYGVNIPELQKAVESGVSLCITVDCGSRAFEPLKWAKENGLDVIVTDHHLADDERGNPEAFAVINPNQSGCTYPDASLAGVGVAFKLAHALLKAAGREEDVFQYLSIAAIGTVADVMKLSGENRAIVSLGLKDLKKYAGSGLKALMEVAGCTSEMTSYDIGFRIAPRINAAGRMDVARHVIELLESDDFVEARRLAELLDSRNRERQRVQQEITEKALFETRGMAGKHFIVVSGQGWHRGVIGLAASRIAEKLHRPTVVISIEDGVGHGSARSIPGFHILEALQRAPELFEQFGGHAAAAGMRIPEENIAALSEKMETFARDKFERSDLSPKLEIDALVRPVTLNLELVEQLKCFEPFGEGNRRPVFKTQGLHIAGEPRVMKEKHLRLRLEDDERRVFEAVWWDGVDRSSGQTLKPNSRIEIAYTAESNVWNGNTRLQLVVEDIRTDN